MINPKINNIISPYLKFIVMHLVIIKKINANMHIQKPIKKPIKKINITTP